MTAPTDMALELALGRASREGCSADVRYREQRAAFQRLVREHLVVLHGLARRLGPEPADAEDLVQETLLRAWRSLRRFRSESDPRTWLYRILVNASRDRWRRQAKALRRASPPRSARDPEGRAIERDAVARVLAAVDTLPRRQRECLLLRVRAGLTHREIAALLSIQEGVVKLHLVHARKKLRRRFGAEVREWGIETR